MIAADQIPRVDCALDGEPYETPLVSEPGSLP